jgi:hypothetical protein
MHNSRKKLFSNLKIYDNNKKKIYPLNIPLYGYCINLPDLRFEDIYKRQYYSESISIPDTNPLLYLIKYSYFTISLDDITKYKIGIILDSNNNLIYDKLNLKIYYQEYNNYILNLDMLPDYISNNKFEHDKLNIIDEYGIIIPIKQLIKYLLLLLNIEKYEDNLSIQFAKKLELIKRYEHVFAKIIMRNLLQVNEIKHTELIRIVLDIKTKFKEYK